MHLMTYWGTFVRLDEVSRSFHQSDYRDEDWFERLLEVELPSEWRSSDYLDFIEDSEGPGSALEVRGPAGETLVVRSTQKAEGVTVTRDGHYLCAGPHFSRLDYTRDKPSAWETFQLVELEDVVRIRHILGADWVMRSTGVLTRREDISTGFRSIKLGAVTIDVATTVQLWRDQRLRASLGARSPGQEANAFYYDVIIDGWKIDRIRRYDPCVFFTAFRAPLVLSQLYLSMTSLLEFGAYDGHIHVITDQSKEDLLREVPKLSPQRLTVQAVKAHDFTGYVASKYLLLDHLAARQRQPLLFSDPDIVYDRAIEPMLCALTTAESVAGPIEDFSLLRSAPSMGTSLLQRDGFQTREACGFNGGTLGFLNLAEHGHVLSMIRVIIMSYSAMSGRGSLSWVDQEVANYVGYKAANVDTRILSRFVRYGLKGIEHDPGGRIGLVHFWPPGHAIEKLRAMQTYYAALIAATIKASSAKPA